IQCTNNLKQIGLALHNYHDAFGVFPPGGISNFKPTGGDIWNANLMSWRALILPRMEQNPLYNAINFEREQNTNDGGYTIYTVYRTVMSTWLCPSDGTNGGGLRERRGPYGQHTFVPLDPATGQFSPDVPVANYAGSFGDNYCGGPLNGGLPW